MLSMRLCIPFSRLLIAKSWRIWLLLIATIVVGAPVSYASRQGAAITGCALLIVLIFLLGTLAMVEPHEQGASGFPGFMRQLPVGDVELVLWPMVIASAFLSLAGWSIAIFVLGSNASFADTWWMGPYLGSVGCLFQASSWVPLKRPELRATSSLLTVAAIVSGPLALGFQFAKPIHLTVFYAALLIASMIVSVRGVSRARHGIAKSVDSPDSGYVIPEVPRFRSRVNAQTWFEERRNGMIMKLLTGMFLGMFLILSTACVFIDPDVGDLLGKRIAISIVSLAAFAIVVPALFGYGGCCGSESDNLAKDRSIIPMIALRPITDLQIVEAKIRMAVRVIARLALITLAVGLIVLTTPTNVDGHRQLAIATLAQVLSWKQVAGLAGLVVVVVLVGFKNAISSIWCAMGRLPIWLTILLSILPIAILVVVVTWLWSHQDEIPTAIKWMPYLVYGFATAKIALLIPSVREIRRKRLVPDPVIVKWLVGCALVGASLYFIGCQTIPSAVYGRVPLAVQIFCLLPLVRVALAPICVHRGRHQ